MPDSATPVAAPAAGPVAPPPGPPSAPPPALDPERARALLDTANSASQSVAVLHFTFMAVCAYLMLAVLGTTDLHLLLGRDIKLPVVDIEVPIVAFYALAPYLLLLMHFNLLLQLQLLSRKLYAFDAAAGPRGTGLGGLRDRLHIFPYTYLLAGDMTPLVRNLTAHVVAITMLALPVATLLAVQIRFLGYQSPVITTAQRVALWGDLLLVIALWPVIMSADDRWQHYGRALLDGLRLGRLGWFAYALLLLGLAMLLYGGDLACVRAGIAATAGALLLALLRPLGEQGAAGLCMRVLPTLLWAIVAGALLLFTPVIGGRATSQPALVFGAALAALLIAPWIFFWRRDLPCGAVVLSGLVTLQLLLPQAIVTEGEAIERWPAQLASWLGHGRPPGSAEPGGTTSPNCPRAREHELGYRNFVAIDPDRRHRDWCLAQGWSLLSCDVLDRARRIDLREQPVFARTPDPDALAALRRDAWASGGDWDHAADRVQRATLKGRQLRHARLEGAVLVRADLRGADLAGACLTGAWLGGAELEGARLPGAVLFGAHLRDLHVGSDDGADTPQGATDLTHAVLTYAQAEPNGLALARTDGALVEKMETLAPLDPVAPVGPANPR